MSTLPPNKGPKDPQGPTWIKYMGLSFRLFAGIGGGTALGWWLQQRSEMKFPLWLLACTFVSVALAFYSLWNSVRQDK